MKTKITKLSVWISCIVGLFLVLPLQNCGGGTSSPCVGDSCENGVNDEVSADIGGLSELQQLFVSTPRSFYSKDEKISESSYEDSTYNQVADAFFGTDYNVTFCNSKHYKEMSYSYYGTTVEYKYYDECFYGTYSLADVDEETLAVTMKFDTYEYTFEYDSYNICSSCAGASPTSNDYAYDSTIICSYSITKAELTDQTTAGSLADCTSVFDYQWGTYSFDTTP